MMNSTGQNYFDAQIARIQNANTTSQSQVKSSHFKQGAKHIQVHSVASDRIPQRNQQIGNKDMFQTNYNKPHQPKLSNNNMQRTDDGRLKMRRRFGSIQGNQNNGNDLSLDRSNKNVKSSRKDTMNINSEAGSLLDVRRISIPESRLDDKSYVKSSQRSFLSPLNGNVQVAFQLKSGRMKMFDSGEKMSSVYRLSQQHRQSDDLVDFTSTLKPSRADPEELRQFTRVD